MRGRAMAEVPHVGGPAESTPRETHAARGGPVSTGWPTFAGLVLLLVGIAHVLTGLAVVLSPSESLAQPSAMLVIPSFGVWGWLHLVVGAIVAVVGAGVMLGQTWARVTGVALAGLSAIINLGFLEAYPVWALVLIVLDVVVIYALTVHASRIAIRD
jgi:hypothetical protein